MYKYYQLEETRSQIYYTSFELYFVEKLQLLPIIHIFRPYKDSYPFRSSKHCGPDQQYP